MRYINLNRRFVERTEYNHDELLAGELLGKRVDWSKVLESDACIIVAPANFGKTTEMRHQARQLRSKFHAAIFLPLRKLTGQRHLQKALERDEREAYERWKLNPASPLTVFLDSFDEAVIPKIEDAESLLDDIVAELFSSLSNIKWIISTRPATLTEQSFHRIGRLLRKQTTVIADTVSPLELDGQTTHSTSDLSTRDRGVLRLFSMAPLEKSQPETYLNALAPDIPAVELLSLARERGLGAFTRNPGGLDILRHIGLLTNPPNSLTDIFTRVAKAIEVLRGADGQRYVTDGSDASILTQAVQRLACASQVCHLVNIELPQETLQVSENSLSARRVLSSMLTEAGIRQLLNSQLFIDTGFQEVKMYPEELRPFLAAQRLSALVASPEQAQRLLQYFTWAAPSGEKGVYREVLPLMGWLGTLNPHCRSVLLEHDPQVLAFFGDLRSDSIPLADKERALTDGVRLIKDGVEPGRGMFILTSENYWQAGFERTIPTLLHLYDECSGHHGVRDVLLEIARVSKLSIFRDRVLQEHNSDYGPLLGDSEAILYLLAIGNHGDLKKLAAALKCSSNPREDLASYMLERLSWTYFTPSEIAELVERLILGDGGGVHIYHSILDGEMLDAATDAQLYQLCRGIVIRIAKHHRRLSSSSMLVGDRYVETAIGVVAALVERTPPPRAFATARLCLMLNRVLVRLYLDINETRVLAKAFEMNTETRRAFLSLAVGQATVGDDEIRHLFGHYRPCNFTSEDVTSANNPRLERIYREFASAPPRSASAVELREPDNLRGNYIRFQSGDRDTLETQIPSLRTGTAHFELAWVAQWLLRKSSHSRYGEIDFRAFEIEAGERIATAVHEGLCQLWRNTNPRFDEDKPNSTYHITAAGLQGLHLELGDGTNLPYLQATEIRRAIRYGTFEMNGYPEWFWPLVGEHLPIATAELIAIANEAGNGQVSRGHANELFTRLTDAPNEVRIALSPLAWNHLLKLGPSRTHDAEAILNGLTKEPSALSPEKLERETWTRICRAFESPTSESVDKMVEKWRGEAIVWAIHWLVACPNRFIARMGVWKSREADAAKAFAFELAAYIGAHRMGVLQQLVKAKTHGIEALEFLYTLTRWVINPSDDIHRPAGVVYHPGAREHAQHMRNNLIMSIASADSQQAYDALGRLRASEDERTQGYLRRIQFELRERQFARAPISQTEYDKFESELTADVTGSMSFAMAVHADLLRVKYDMERGEHSLRSFFNEVEFRRAETRGPNGRRAGLALEEHFQRLLASELNHHARERYSVTVEPQTAEKKRRDVLCSRNDWKASIELKMSVRWTLQDYVIALEQQLVGQYMRDSNANIGFLVLVLQANRQWDGPGGKRSLNFEEVIALLSERAQAIEAEERLLYLRVIGIDATTPADFRVPR